MASTTLRVRSGMLSSGWIYGIFALLGTALPAIAAQAPADAGIQQVNALQGAVEAAEAVRAVKRLQYSYAQYLTEGLWDEATDLFARDAASEFGKDSFRGKPALRRHLMAEAQRNGKGLDAGQLNLHLMMQPIVTLGADGRSAKAAWHEVRMLGRFGKSASWAGGIYENEYQIENGKWRISRLRYFPQYSGAYGEPGHHAPARWDVPYHFDSNHVGVSVPQDALRALAARAQAAGSPAARLTRLVSRVQALGDETQVQNLQHAYGYYLDRKLYDDVADLFAAAGTFEVAPRGSYKGRAHIRRALEVFHGAGPLRRGELFDHIILSTVVTVAQDGRSASARSLQLSQLGFDGEYARWEFGVYENEFLQQDGKWRIRAVHYYPRMATDYDEGWAKKALPAALPSKDFPPDSPSRAFAGYPKAQRVALDFANPVKAPQARASANAPWNTLLAQTQHAVDAAIAVDAVENLNSSYGYYIDESAWDDMANTFAATRGSKEMTGAGVYVGRDKIRAVLNLRGPKGGRTANFFTIHQLTQPVIHIAADGTSANARLRLFQMGGNADGSSGSWIGGTYENTAFFEDGEWKFGRQDLHHHFNASYRNGWARFAAARAAAAAGRSTPSGGITQGLGGATSAAGYAKQIPPDTPIRSRQYTFPEITEPAFHYVNPVSGRMPAELLP